jgi:single-strand DNA-binding protein
MSEINGVYLSGHITRDAEIRYTNGGMCFVRFGLAQDRTDKKGDTWEKVAMFFDCSLKGKYAESIHQYLTKGKKVSVQGRLRHDRWQDKDGKAQSKICIDVLGVDLGSRPVGEAGNVAHSELAHEPSGEVFDDDIPS